MGLEAATYISGLDPNNPLQTDLKREGDNHLRLIKRVLQQTFPGASRTFTFPTALAKTTGFTVTAAQSNTLFYCDTSGGYYHAYLPVLTTAEAGWSCQFIKTNVGTAPVLVSVQTGTLQSGEVAGLPWGRRCIPGHATTALWTGASWFLTRVPSVPVGSCIEFHGPSLPVGYEWPNGQTLATSFYSEYATVMGTYGTHNRSERVAAMVDRTGIGLLASYINGDVMGAVGGQEYVALTEAQLASHAHSASGGGSVTIDYNGDHQHMTATNQGSDQINPPGSHPMSIINALGIGELKYQMGWNSGQTQANTSPSSTAGGHWHTGSISVGVTVNAAGSSHAHSNLQPTMMTNFILVVE